jgi:hypothetical protein
VSQRERLENSQSEGLVTVSPFARMGEASTKPSNRPNLDKILMRRRAEY